MENETIKKLEEEAQNVISQMLLCQKNSEKYNQLLDTFKELIKLKCDEQHRINSVKDLELKEKELDFKRSRSEIELDIEERKLDDQKHARVFEIIVKVVTCVLMVAGNLATILMVVRMNNSGETLTTFESRFIQPEKFR